MSAGPSGSAPLAVVVGGLPGSGKSVLGAALAARLGAALLDQDTLTGPLVAVIADLVGDLDLDDERSALLTRAARYETVLAGAEDSLRCGTPAVLVAPFTAERREPDAWDAVRSRLAAAGALPRLVWADLPPEILARRLAGRAAARDAGKLADLEAFTRAADWQAPRVPHIRVDTTGALDAAALTDLHQQLLS